MENSNYNIVETLLLILASDEGKLKIYLEKKKTEPYKGYWVIPNNILNNQTTLEENANNIYLQTTGLDKGTIFQSKAFSALDRDLNQRVIAITYIAITDKTLIDMKKQDKDKSWFQIDELPKLGYDHENIINEVISELRPKITTNYDDMLVKFFPSDFTLPELQNFYEYVLNKPIDRRNFHKKFVNQDLVVDTGFKVTKGSGRPGTLYRFNLDKMKGKRIWMKKDLV